ncbi:Cyclin-dependent kinase 5 activator 1 [Cichlidogyrus casuarinus]|uniref:Cyclin-dependent kinase 5 activator 1 n=1 Tax=Cichlidogyrus casuarinus TaxID=1844966 RepID=A0ABD2QM18_9PLAT
MGNQVTTPPPSSQNSPSAGFRHSIHQYVKSEINNDCSRHEQPGDLFKSYFELPQSSTNALVNQEEARQRQIVELHLSQSVSDLSLKNHLKREQKVGSFIKGIRNRFKSNKNLNSSKENNKHVTSEKISTKRAPKLRRAETECPAISRDGSCQQFLTIPSARSVNRLRSGGDSESDVSCSNRLQRRSNQMRSGSERSSSILDGCTSGTDLNSECSSRQSFELSSEYRRQHSFESNDDHLNPVKKSPRKWSERKGMSLDDPSFDPPNQLYLGYVNKHFSSLAETDSKNYQNCELRHKNSNLDSIKEAGNEKIRKTVLIKPTNAPKGHAKDKSFFDTRSLSKSISCYALKLLPSNSTYTRKHEQANSERPKLHRMSKIALDTNCISLKSGELTQKPKSRCAVKSAPLIQASTGELLRYLANFVATRCAHLMGYPTLSNVKSLTKTQDPIGLQPIAIISWIRSIDRNLIVNGWSEIAFLNPATVTFLYMLLKEYLSEDVNSEYELHSIIMTCLYLSYSYMGNEISYPLRPFIVAEMANRARKNRKLDSRNKRTLSASVSNMANPTLASSSNWKSSVHYGEDVEGSINNLAGAEGNLSPSPGTNINVERDIFFDRCLRVMNEHSTDMLRINSDQNLFAQLLTELISYSDYHLSKSPSKYTQKQIPTSPIVVGSIELCDNGSGRVKAYPKSYPCSRGKNAVQVSNTDANSTFST